MGTFIAVRSDIAQGEVLLNANMVESIEQFDKMYIDRLEPQILYSMMVVDEDAFAKVHVERYKSIEKRDKKYEELKKKLT